MLCEVILLYYDLVKMYFKRLHLTKISVGCVEVNRYKIFFIIVIINIYLL